ncbi:MAG: MFS transporter [Deferribacterales bacterium]
MNSQKVFTKDFILGASVNFFLMLGYYIPMMIMTLYVTESIGGSIGEGGFAAGLFVIGALISRMFCGKWMSFTGRWNLLFYSTLICLGTVLLYFTAHSLYLLYAVRLVHGIAYGAAATAVGTIVAGMIPAERRGEGLGYYLLSITLASAVGPFIGMFIISHGGFDTIFSVCTAAAVICLAGTVFMSRDKEVLVAERQPAGVRGGLSSYFEFAAVPISFVCLVMYFCYSGVMAFITPFAKQEGLTAAASMFFVVYSVVILVSRPYTGKLFDSKGENVSMYPSFVAVAAGMCILGASKGAVGVLTSAALIGFGIGVVQSCGLAIAVKLTPPDRLALANSTFYAFVDAGVGMGPLVLGLVIPATGYKGMYLLLAVISLLCLVLYYFTHGRNAGQPQIAEEPIPQYKAV